jgi:hypothetical protein
MKKFSHRVLLIISVALLCQPVNAGPLSIGEAKYGALEIKKANITIEFPKNWHRQGKNTAWSPQRKGLPLVGFKWINIESDWKEENMLPKNSDFLGPFVIDLGWEQGSLYIVQVKAGKRKNLFEIHTVISRMEANLAYDFYASANSLAQLTAIDVVIQRLMHSGQLHDIRSYVSEDLEDCEDEEFELDCGINEEEFFDENGCGCLLVPQKDAVYDN